MRKLTIEYFKIGRRFWEVNLAEVVGATREVFKSQCNYSAIYIISIVSTTGDAARISLTSSINDANELSKKPVVFIVFLQGIQGRFN